jgi:hypothetical protein
MSTNEDQSLPTELLEPPGGDFPAAPPQTAVQLLPFDELSWENFERLCLRVARLTGRLGRARLYGVQGQLQSGIDFYTVLPSGRYATYQCKRINRVSASDIRAAVDKFLSQGRWSRVSERFVFCTSERAVRTQLSDAIEKQGTRLASQATPIDFEVWDAEELSLVLKHHEDVVRDFFGAYWVDAFFGVHNRLDGSAETLLQKVLERTQGRTQFVTNDWASDQLRDLLDSLRRDNAETYARLNDLLGSPPEGKLLYAGAATPPEWLRDADGPVWDVFARIAESQGEWTAASLAWERLAERQASSSARVGSLVSGAIAAKVGEDTDRYDELMQRAAEIDNQHPRLVLELMPEDTPPAEQLAILEKLQTDNRDELALISARKAFAHLLTPDVSAARDSADEVENNSPGSLLARGLAVSITVQEGRLAVMANRPLDRAALRVADLEAKSVRERLIAQKRWLESTRLLMLRADIHALLGERPKASIILRSVREEELSTTEQKIVLASSAAERALDWVLARDLLQGADETPTVVRLRLEISEAIGTPTEREAALAGLDEIVREGGPEAGHAAFLRLVACLGSQATPWNDEAAVYLKKTGFERAAVTAEAVYCAQHDGYDEAVRLLLPHGNATWALATRMRIALSPRAPRKAGPEAAEKLLAIGPSHSQRVEAAKGFARGAEFERAREVLVSVARDPGAPESARADAYEALMHVVGNDLSDWDVAFELYGEWAELAPGDKRAPKWAPRIANRRSHT